MLWLTRCEIMAHRFFFGLRARKTCKSLRGMPMGKNNHGWLCGVGAGINHKARYEFLVVSEWICLQFPYGIRHTNPFKYWPSGKVKRTG